MTRLLMPYAVIALLLVAVLHNRTGEQANAAPASVALLTSEHLCGVYRGVVESNIDPQRTNRVLLRVSAVSTSPLWALPGLSTGSAPTVGTQVWVMFEQGSMAHPVWFGAVPRGM